VVLADFLEQPLLLPLVVLLVDCSEQLLLPPVLQVEACLVQHRRVLARVVVEVCLVLEQDLALLHLAEVLVASSVRLERQRLLDRLQEALSTCSRRSPP